MKSNKTFDCIATKRRIQAERWAEYERRRAEFASFQDFVEARCQADPWVIHMRSQLRAQCADPAARGSS